MFFGGIMFEYCMAMVCFAKHSFLFDQIHFCFFLYFATYTLIANDSCILASAIRWVVG